MPVPGPGKSTSAGATPRTQARWEGKKIPMEIFYEAYMAEKLDFKGDLYETMLRRNQLFRFCFTLGRHQVLLQRVPQART